MKNRIYIYSILLSILLTFASCVEEPAPALPKDTPRTILVYMIASNSLGSYGYDAADIAEMGLAVKSGNTNNCRILVYHVTYGAVPKLFEIVRSSTGDATHVTHKEYKNEDKSTTPERMAEVFADMKRYAPAKDYGLVLWSHSNGWADHFPLSTNRNYKHFVGGELLLSRGFGDDKGSKITIDMLELALPSNTFSFIYSDACYMGSIEIAYQLRKKTRYYVGSASLLPADGMPYDKNIPIFCQDNLDLRQACDNTYQHYNKLSGASRSITISLVDCKEIDALASVCKDIYATGNLNQNVSSIQRYIALSDGKCIYFDLEQYTKMVATSTLQVSAIESQLAKTVLYKAATPNVFSKLAIDPNKFSGVSSYILNTGDASIEAYYKTLDWYINVYSN